MPRTRTTPNGSYRKGLFFSKNPADPPTIRYWCNACDQSVSRLGDIPRHMRLHSDTFRFMCDRSGCRQVGGGVGFHQKANLSMHLENAHDSGNKFPCPHRWENRDGSIMDCPARFKTNRSLLKHRSQAHGFNLGDDVSKVQIPTPEGTTFRTNDDASSYRSRRRSGNSPGAVMYFQDGCGDDNDAEAKFVDGVLSNRDELERFLAPQGVPYPTLPFNWPAGSSGGKQRTAKFSTESTPTPEQHYQIAVPLAGPAAAHLLPYPNAPAVDIGSPAAEQVGQQNAANDPVPPVLYPFVIQPLATTSTVPSAQPAPPQGMTTVGNSAVALQATNLAYSVPDGVLAPQPQLPTSDGTINPSVLVAPGPATSPSHGEMDVLNSGYSSSPPSYGPDTLPSGENDVSSELSSAPMAEFDYQSFLELSKWFPGADKGLMEFVLACQA